MLSPRRVAKGTRQDSAIMSSKDNQLLKLFIKKIKCLEFYVIQRL